MLLTGRTPVFFCETMPTFSFIIPVKPGGTVKALVALRQLSELDYQFEILIAEGTNPSLQRNMAAQRSQGDILYFLDDDSQVSPDCLSQCDRAFYDPAVAVAGGPSLTPESDSRLQHLFAYALTSIFGAGAMRDRYRSVGQPRVTTQKELILCNLAIRREIFVAAGGLDERLYPNEENELLDRIGASGHKLMHIPAMAVLRSQRSSVRSFIRQMFSYGRGRAQQTIIAGFRSPISFMPMAFVTYLMLLPLLLSVPLSSSPLIAYIVLDLIFTGMAVINSGSPTALLLLFVFPLLHCANGIGLLYGFILERHRPTASGRVEIKRIKEFGQTNW
jgi:succinoglycan biosynthesis protein ExoA